MWPIHSFLIAKYKIVTTTTTTTTTATAVGTKRMKKIRRKEEKKKANRTSNDTKFRGHIKNVERCLKINKNLFPLTMLTIVFCSSGSI